jgi:ankyrin repeat protein
MFVPDYQYNGYGQDFPKKILGLHVCAYFGSKIITTSLLERDDVAADSQDRDGLTPLSLAARGGHEAVVRLLTSLISDS